MAVTAFDARRRSAAGITSEVVDVTPEMAAEWLARSGNNRPVSRVVVSRYAAAMTGGRWSLTGEAIKFAADGALLDGQHRLAAIVQSGVTVQTLVVEGVASAAFAEMDSGKPRSIADALSVLGYANAPRLSSAVRTLLWYEWYGDMVNIGKGSGPAPTAAQVIERLARNPQIEDSVRRVATSGLRRIGAASAVFGALHYLFATVDSDDAEGFYVALETGAGLPVDDPIYRLRERLIDNATSPRKLPVGHIAAITIKAWNAWRLGRRVQILSWRPGGANPEPFPRIG